MEFNKVRKPFLIVVQGATAVGKSDLALQLADRLKGYIISADSRQVYQKLAIGTARPSQTELEAVNHFLIAELDPKESFSAGEFARRAGAIIEQRLPQLPIIAGGTGFYCKALLEGLSTIPKVTDDAQKKLSEVEDRYAKLQEVDPQLAKKVHPHDTSRIERGLLVYFSSSKPLSSFWQQEQNEKRYDAFSILLTRDRQELYQRINRRLDKMVAKGLLEEIKSLLEEGYSWEDPGLNTVGYKEFKDYFAGKRSLTTCLEKAKQATRNFAKRQLTWYRKIKFDLTLSASDDNLPTILSCLQNERPSLFE